MGNNFNPKRWWKKFAYMTEENVHPLIVGPRLQLFAIECILVTHAIKLKSGAGTSDQLAITLQEIGL